MRTKLEVLDDEFRVKFDHNPIHHMEYRLKSPHSMVEKLRRRGLPVTIPSIRENLHDVAGVRVICNYIDDIYRIADLLVKQDDITLLCTKDYIANPKPNGYRSLHLVIEIPIFLSEQRLLMPVEVQIRTIAMDFWASLEHQLKLQGGHPGAGRCARGNSTSAPLPSRISTSACKTFAASCAVSARSKRIPHRLPPDRTN